MRDQDGKLDLQTEYYKERINTGTPWGTIEFFVAWILALVLLYIVYWR